MNPKLKKKLVRKVKAARRRGLYIRVFVAKAIASKSAKRYFIAHRLIDAIRY